MGACLLDLIPDVEEIFKKVDNFCWFHLSVYSLVWLQQMLSLKVLCDVKAEYGVEVTFPVAPFSVVLGFGLILIIEQAVLHFQVRRWEIVIFFYWKMLLKQEQLVVRVREERQPLIHSTPG